MAKVLSIGSFPFCVRTVGSFEEGYNGSLPFYYLPIEFENLTQAMAMFWRVKSWRVVITRQTSFAPDPDPPFESYSEIADFSFFSPVANESELICKNGVEWEFFGIVNIDYDINLHIVINISNVMFILDDVIYLPFAVDVSLSAHGGFSDGIDVSTELGDVTLISVPSTLSILGTSYNLLTAAEEPSVVSGISCQISPAEYWAYANPDGSDPEYNTSTGEPLT